MRRFDWILVAALIASLALMVVANEDPLARDAICHHLSFCPRTDHPTFWNRLIYDLGNGSMITIVFYGLLVRLPEEQKRRRLRSNIALQYRRFKEDCIAIFVGAADGSYSPAHVRELADQKAFRSYFQENVGDREDRWGKALNLLNDRALQELVVAMEIFRDEISYVLDNGDVKTEEAFAFFKRLSSVLHFAKLNAASDYDSIKSLAQFFWQMLSGWDWVTGYQEEDVVEKMIRDV